MPHLTLGLLGVDDRVAAVVDAAAARGHAVVVTCDLPSGSRLAAGLRTVPWETLLDATSCDAVLVGTDAWSGQRAEAVRMLVQAGRTLLLSQPPVLSMLWAYELDMIRRDTGARLVPLLADRLHPLVGRLRGVVEAGLANAGPLGLPESLLLTRRMPERTRDTVLAALARDADLVRVLVGEPARLGTLGAADQPDAWGTLAVGFSGTGQVPARWQVAPGADPGLTLTLQHARGNIVVEVPDDLTRDLSSDDLAVDGGSQSRAALAVAALERAVGAAPAEGEAEMPDATWADAARAIEFAETVPRSLARGRAIDLHQEEFSEIGTFRGTMASLGCGLVLAALVILVLATLVGGIAAEFDWQLGKDVAGAWPWLVLVVMTGFLALQVLPLVVSAGPSPPGDEPATPRRRG